MNLTDFTAAVETDLQLRGGAFDQRELRDFLASAWPLVEADDLPAKWADAFLDERARAVRRAKLAEAQAILNGLEGIPDFPLGGPLPEGLDPARAQEAMAKLQEVARLIAEATPEGMGELQEG
jgi:hypothetical protein